MIARTFFTVAALLLAAGGFLGESPLPGGRIDLSGILFLFVAIITWFEWETVRDGFRNSGNPMLLGRLAPLLEQLPYRKARESARRRRLD